MAYELLGDAEWRSGPGRRRPLRRTAWSKTLSRMRLAVPIASSASDRRRTGRKAMPSECFPYRHHRLDPPSASATS